MTFHNSNAPLSSYFSLKLKREKKYPNHEELDSLMNRCEQTMVYHQRYRIAGFLGLIIPGSVFALLSLIFFISFIASHEEVALTLGLVFVSIALILLTIGIVNMIVRKERNENFDRIEKYNQSLYYQLLEKVKAMK